jgi:N-acetylglucosaminyl-diphospho-decaprenol L-rhamnosyltransferase
VDQEALVDVVIVSYNSRERLRPLVEPLVGSDALHVVVVDNASTDDSLTALEGLPATALGLDRNHGFAYGCNRGIEQGTAPYVLLLNPDTRTDPATLLGLVAALERNPRAGAVSPRIVDSEGRLDFSLRRFPRLVSTFARALFVHRVFPNAPWVDEVIRDHSSYERAADVEWVSGACVLLRREALERIGGLDETFFMYCEDTDLCRRLSDAGWAVRFEPAVVVTHEGGASAPRSGLLPVLAASRRRYAEKHRGRIGALAERAGIALEAAIRIVVSGGGRAARRGHARALGRALGAASEPT